MSAQNHYGFAAPVGIAGGLVDVTPYVIDSKINEENNGVMKFGFGVVRGTNAKTGIKLPVSASTASLFEGVTTNNRSTELDLDGNLRVLQSAAVGVLKYGRIYARVMTSISPAYGDALYLVTSGTDVGKFTNAAAGGSDNYTTVAVKGRFLGGVDATTGVAPVELYNQAQS